MDVAWNAAEERPRIAPEKRRAMVATAVIFGTFVVLLGSFTVYSQVIMPTPVALGASSGTFTLPTPIQMEPRAEISTPTMAAAPAVEAPSEMAPVEVDVVVEDPAPGIPSTHTHDADRDACCSHRRRRASRGPRSSARLEQHREVAAAMTPTISAPARCGHSTQVNRGMRVDSQNRPSPNIPNAPTAGLSSVPRTMHWAITLRR